MSHDRGATLYKLIILFMLNKADYPLTTSQLSEFVLEQGYTTYFKFQEALSDLVKTGLVIVEPTNNRSLYHLTDEGEVTLSHFENQISPAIQVDIMEYLKERHFDLKEESGVKSTYRKTALGEYQVRLLMMEDSRNLIDLKIMVPTEKEAEAMATNWIKKSPEMYAHIMSELL